MKRKTRRLYTVCGGLCLLGVAAALALTAMEDSLVFFYAPSDIAARDIPPGRTVRVGGLVEAGSVERDGATIRFRITDTAASTPVRYTGLLPDLFREGQGVVAEGRFAPDGAFAADSLLARHDETYMPPEIADALERAGHPAAAAAAQAEPAE